MDALKKAEKEKKEAAKRRQTGQHPILSTGEHSIVEDDTQVLSTTMTNEVDGSEELTQEVSLSMELQDKDEDFTLADDEPTFSTTQIEQENTVVMDDQNLGDVDDDTILTLGEKELDDIDLDLEDTQLISDMTDETIIERTMETSEFSRDDFSDVTDELRMDIAEDNLDDETLGLKLETLENQNENEEEISEPTIEKQVSDSQEQQNYRTNLGQLTDPSLELEALDSGSVTQMLRDIGQHEGQPTPVVASTVFAASKSENWGNRFMIGLSAALGLLLLVAAGLFIQYKITPDVPKVLSPSVAKGVEAKQEPLIKSLDELVTPNQAAVTSVNVPETEEIETQYISHDEDKSTTELPVTSNEVVEQPVETVEITTSSDSSEEPIETAATSVANLDTPTESITPSIDGKPITKEIVKEEVVFSPVAAPVSPSMIKISKKKKPRPELDTNKRAFNAFQEGNYDVASSLYRISLKETPDNRDALLGMAAIELKKGNTQSAYQIYRKLLKLNPKDSVAKVSILNLQNQVGNVTSESTVKDLIQQNPENPSLHFSLGNLYSKQQRWPEAQQAFFDAYSRQPGNADYALNLAISLDHMGQSKAAIEYYRAALNLSKNKPSSFSASNILARIDALSVN